MLSHFLGPLPSPLQLSLPPFSLRKWRMTRFLRFAGSILKRRWGLPAVPSQTATSGNTRCLHRNYKLPEALDSLLGEYLWTVCDEFHILKCSVICCSSGGAITLPSWHELLCNFLLGGCAIFHNVSVQVSPGSRSTGVISRGRGWRWSIQCSRTRRGSGGGWSLQLTLTLIKLTGFIGIIVIMQNIITITGLLPHCLVIIRVCGNHEYYIRYV